MREEFEVRPLQRLTKDVDRQASREYMRGRKEPKPEYSICSKCGKRLPIRMMALVGLDCYECRRCLYA